MSLKHTHLWYLHSELHQLFLRKLFLNEHQCKMAVSWLLGVFCSVLECSRDLEVCVVMWFPGIEAAV